MLTISKIYQFFHYEGSSNFTLSGLPSDVKDRINRIFTANSSGTTLVNWRPTGGAFQALTSLVPGGTYFVDSKTAGFISYEIPIDAVLEKEQDDSIPKIYYLFTYQGCSNFTLSGLSSDVRDRINRIFTANSSGTTLVNWRPTGGAFQALTALVPGGTYLVDSKTAGFAPYTLGIPSKCAPSSSSSSSVVLSSSSSSSSVVLSSSSSSSSVVLSSSSSSSSNLCPDLDTSLVTVLNSNSDLPGLYYGENLESGWVAISDRELEFRYDALTVSELPFSSNVWIDGEGVATINYPPSYLGRQFCVVRSGSCCCGVVAEDDIYLSCGSEEDSSSSSGLGCCCFNMDFDNPEAVFPPEIIAGIAAGKVRESTGFNREGEKELCLVDYSEGDCLSKCDLFGSSSSSCPWSWTDSTGCVNSDCVCFEWSCESNKCSIVLTGCPDSSDPCVEAGNCCETVGLSGSCEVAASNANCCEQFVECGCDSDDPNSNCASDSCSFLDSPGVEFRMNCRTCECECFRDDGNPCGD